jgi:DNA gyrase subunit A
MRIVIDIGKNEDPRTVLAALYKYTAMKGTFGVIMLSLVDGEPRVLPLKKLLQVFVEHRREIVRRRSIFDQARAKERAHILEGLVKALDIIDQVIKLIRASRDTDVARQGLVKTLKFSEAQANAILEMPLRRLAALERKKLEEELAEKRKLIRFLDDLLSHPGKVLGVIREELVALRERFGDGRRTTIIGDAKHQVKSTDDVLTTHELMPTETTYVIVGQNGRIARSTETPRITAQADIVPAAIVKTTTRDLVYVVGSSGKAIVLSVANLPVEDVIGGRGIQLSTLSFPQDDDIAGVFALPRNGAVGHVLTSTSGGMVKRSEVGALPLATGQVFTIMGITEGDNVVSTCHTSGNEDIILFTQQGMAIRFRQEEVRAMGLPATGVVGIKLMEGDIVLSMGAADENNEALEVVLGTTDGHAKRLAFKEYPVQGRGGKGVITAKLIKENTVADAVIATEEDAIVYVTLKGGAKSLKAHNLKRRGRPATGDEAIAINGSDRLSRMMVVTA